MVRIKSREDIIFDIFNTILMLILIFLTLYPVWFCIVGSFNEGLDYMRGGVNFWPRKFTLSNYRVVLMEPRIKDAYKITILRTIIGVITHVLFTSLFAYGFSRRNLIGKKIYGTMGIITMFFSGGLIPSYLLYKWLRLLNSFWVYIIPALFNFWNVIIFQSFFREIPESINESARIDGANEYQIYFYLILPLSKPVLAALALFTGVWHWNSYFDSMVFTTSQELSTIQLLLMKIIRSTEGAANVASRAGEMLERQRDISSTTVQMATMVITSAPIMMLYPFLQKYFVKGVMIGSIKG
ncbi:MAG: carbohydrate ABC transporter permease [Clostridiales bacterium]|jgi:putative aldouronate transport system permease protein|nr:carbohydrate ABC transporter permease [Clostridiales bacterium]